MNIEVNFDSLGGGKVSEDTFTMSYGTVTEYTVSCGFQPTKIFVYKITASGTGWADGSRVDLYDADMDAAHQFRTLRVGGDYAQTETIPPSSDGISALNSSGFRFEINSSAWDGTYRYVAVG